MRTDMRPIVVGLYACGNWGERFTFRIKGSTVHNTFATFQNTNKYSHVYKTTADAFRVWLKQEGYNAELVAIENSYQRIDFKDEDSWTLFKLKWLL